MAYLEGWVKEHLRRNAPEVGEVHEEVRDPRTLVATRPFLTTGRIGGERKRRGSRMLPEVIDASGTGYVIDGHHKVRRACDAGESSITCRVLHSSRPEVGSRLSRAAHGLVAMLPIRRA